MVNIIAHKHYGWMEYGAILVTCQTAETCLVPTDGKTRSIARSLLIVTCHTKVYVVT